MVSPDGRKYSSNYTFTLSLELQESHRPTNLFFHVVLQCMQMEAYA